MYKCSAGSTAAIPLGPFVNQSGAPLSGLAIRDTEIWITSNGAKMVLGATGSMVVTTDAQGVAFFPAARVAALLAVAGYFRIDVQATGALTYWEDVFVIRVYSTTPTPTPSGGTPIDWETVRGNVGLTLANLTALRAEIMANPKPQYSVRGHSYDWPGLYRLLSQEIDNCMRQLSRMEPFEDVGQGF